MDETPRVVRRVGPRDLSRCSSNVSCPDIFELSDGRFAIIGTVLDITEVIHGSESVQCASADSAVVIPRDLLVQARESITDSGG